MSGPWLKEARCIIIAALPGDPRAPKGGDTTIGRSLPLSELRPSHAEEVLRLPPDGSIEVAPHAFQGLPEGTHLFLLMRSRGKPHMQSTAFGAALRNRTDELVRATEDRHSAAARGDVPASRDAAN